MKILSAIYNQFLLNPVVLSLLSGFFGALIGGHFANKLKNNELKIYEKATALSIVEELKVLLDVYQKEFDDAYSEIGEGKFLVFNYQITQDYTTIYTQNAGEIGLIKNKELREAIIKSYTYLKKYIEELLIYTNNYKNFNKLRNEFIARAYPYAINTACAEANNSEELRIIRNKIEAGDWSWLNMQFLNQVQVLTFFTSDENKVKDLILNSEELKKRFNELKELINKTYKLAIDIYKGK